MHANSNVANIDPVAGLAPRDSARPAWVGRAFRLDPAALPASNKIASGIDAGNGEIAYIVEAGMIYIARHLPCGIPMTMRFSPRAFVAIAARTLPGAKPGSMIATLELMHTDPALSLPLLVADNLDDIAADWTRWARLFCLPMAMIDQSGRVDVVDAVNGSVRLAAPKPRRRRAASVRRRPRFLMRRKMGRPGEASLVIGREICAWG